MVLGLAKLKRKNIEPSKRMGGKARWGDDPKDGDPEGRPKLAKDFKKGRRPLPSGDHKPRSYAKLRQIKRALDHAQLVSTFEVDSRLRLLFKVRMC